MVSPQQEKKQEVTGWAGLGWLHPLMFEPRTFPRREVFLLLASWQARHVLLPTEFSSLASGRG